MALLGASAEIVDDATASGAGGGSGAGGRSGAGAAGGGGAASAAGTWMKGYEFALSGPIYAGTNEIQRNVIAERVLGLPRR